MYAKKIKNILKAILPPPARTVKSFFEQVLTSIKDVKTRVEKSEALAAESVWAHIFNNTISNTTWLKDMAFSPGRWAVGYAYLYVMYRLLNEIHPQNILELGLGQSTRMIAQYVSAFDDVNHEVVEHDKDWCNFFSKSFKLSERTKITTLGLEIAEYKGTKLWTYKGFGEICAGRKYDFISVDAPFGKVDASSEALYSRVDIVSLLPDILAPSFVIMIDDTERLGERNTIAEIENILQKSGIKHRKGTYKGAKDCTLICAEHLAFLTTM